MNIVFRQCHRSNYKSGRTSPIKYIVIHYTAGNGDTAKNNADYYAENKVGASAHYFVDEHGTIYQSVRDCDTAWAVGGTSVYKHPECRNANSVSVELCSRNFNGGGRAASDGGWYFKDETVECAARLVRSLMQKYNIPLKNVVRHYDVWNKICPAPFVNDARQWQNFLKLAEGNNMERIYNYVPEMPEWARGAITKLYSAGYLRGDGDALSLTLSEIRMYCVLVRILEDKKIL